MKHIVENRGATRAVAIKVRPAETSVTGQGSLPWVRVNKDRRVEELAHGVMH